MYRPGTDSRPFPSKMTPGIIYAASVPFVHTCGNGCDIPAFPESSTAEASSNTHPLRPRCRLHINVSVPTRLDRGSWSTRIPHSVALDHAQFLRFVALTTRAVAGRVDHGSKPTRCMSHSASLHCSDTDTTVPRGNRLVSIVRRIRKQVHSAVCASPNDTRHPSVESVSINEGQD